MCAASLVSAFRQTVSSKRSFIALRSSDGRIELTWTEYEVIADQIAAGLAALGIGVGDTVAILMGNRPEWQLVDTAVLIAGGTPFSLYVNAPAEQSADLVRRAHATVVIGEHYLVSALRQQSFDNEVKFISVDDQLVELVDTHEAPREATTLSDLRRLGNRTPFNPPTVQPDAVATLIYTSGTTGSPKGVELSHASIEFIGQFIGDNCSLTDGRTISYLPHAHIVDRIVGHYLALIYGNEVTTIADVRTLFDALPDIRPTLFTSVPRIWQRLHVQILNKIDAMDDADRQAFYEALESAKLLIESTEAQVPVPDRLRQVVDTDRAKWFVPMRKRFGLNDVGWFVTGSAPLPRSTHLFFAALGMPLHDLWGLSETTGVATFTGPGDHQIGTVGRALPHTDVRLAEDGEVLVRGPHLAKGYRGDPVATAEVFDSEGWFHTGDLGEWRGDHLSIVGRKKELIISAGGENMSPTRIEDVVSSESALVSSLIVIGDRRPYNVALIVPDLELTQSSLGVVDNAESLVDHPRVIATFDRILARANERLARHEQIRRHVLLPKPWTVDSGEYTPTLKIRRRNVETKFADVIDKLYEDSVTNSK